MDPAREAARFE